MKGKITHKVVVRFEAPGKHFTAFIAIGLAGCVGTFYDPWFGFSLIGLSYFAIWLFSWYGIAIDQVKYLVTYVDGEEVTRKEVERK